MAKDKPVAPLFIAQIDQDWEHACAFVQNSNPQMVKDLTDCCAADDPAQLIAWMKQEPRVADVVQRLALLALHEAAMRITNRRADESAGV